MVIRILILVLLFIQGLCFSQNVDSIEAVYSKYYHTALLTVSPSGRHVVLNHNNVYGKDDDELVDTKTGKGTALEKHINYQFLDDDQLLMTSIEHTRFKNLKTGQYRDVMGNYVVTCTDRSEKVVLYGHGTKELMLVSKDGEVLWKAQNVMTYQLDKEHSRLIYITNDQLGIRDLRNDQTKNYILNSDVQWMSFHGDLVYCSNIKESQLELYILNVLSDKMTKQVINSPEGFVFAKNLSGYFEIREDRHFVFPLYLKNKLNKKKDSELKITYSNRNSRDKRLNRHLGIFDIEQGEWNYLPREQDELPIYKFLNDKGDFIVYDESGDTVEEQQNVVLDFKLILDYGKRTYLLPQKRIEEGNYLWDSATRQFIYFDHKRWMCHQIETGKDHELLPLNTDGWESRKENGLVNAPALNPVNIKGKSSILISDQYDYFLVDLKTHQLKRITNGGEKHIKYQLQTSKDQYPRSSWNLKLAKIDLEEEMTFKLFNEINYDSGFANYFHKKNKTKLYRPGHYKELVQYKKGHFLTSDFALEPFKLIRSEHGKYSVVYESLRSEMNVLENLAYKIFKYSTRYGTANAAVLFPVGYDKQKKYPMVVNIYDRMSFDILNFLAPSLRVSTAFNYLHYLMNDYIVLLPDLKYETANVKNSVITSLEKCIDTVKLLASIDDKNVGVLGLSFGGYETGLALSNSKYFKTGVAGVMISDLVSYSLSNSEKMMPMPNYMRSESRQNLMVKSVFEAWNGYLENSPVYHMKNIDVPILIWNGSKDNNVSPDQSKMFFLGMKRLQKKAVLLEYLNDSHNIISVPNQLDINTKIWQWFDHYLKNKSPANWIVPLTK